MPNTLAHIGAQGFVIRAADRRADLQWILAGCVIADVPWIAQRVVRKLPLVVDDYDLRAYALAQSSLAGCLLLCAALALLSAAPRRIFALLAASSLLHLLLDASQTKTGSGVHLFAPLSWELLSFGWFWPESPITLALTASGLLFVALAWRRRHDFATGLRLPRRRRLLVAAAFLAAYAVLPWLVRSGPVAADNHSLQTLRELSERPGRVIELDRAPYFHRGGRSFIKILNLEEIEIAGPAPERSGNLSLTARFVDERTLVLLDSHLHTAPRDLPTYLGLAWIALVWLESVLRSLRRRRGAAGQGAADEGGGDQRQDRQA